MRSGPPIRWETRIGAAGLCGGFGWLYTREGPLDV